MKLNKIYFDSYKSLIEEELVINDGCIGIVGINESGKTNILNAVSYTHLTLPTNREV